MAFILKDPSNKEMDRFIKQLKQAGGEKDVDSAWQGLFRYYYEYLNKIPGVHTELHNFLDTDGYLERTTMVGSSNILMEFKHKTNLDKLEDRIRIIVQLIYYMKKIQQEGYVLPNILVGADENQAFVLYAPNFYSYLDDGSYKFGEVAPSAAFQKDTKLVSDLMEDHNITTWTYSFNNNKEQNRYNIRTFFQEINQYSEDTQTKLKVEPKNIALLFDVFKDMALPEGTRKKMESVAEVGLFMQLLKGEQTGEYYQHPIKPNVLVTPNAEIEVNSTFMNAFFKRYDRNLTPVQIDELTAIADRLIEDEDRRFTGDFWTPTIWALRADEMMREAISEDYKETSLIWDPAAGTSNLTRDFSYTDLYVSTLHKPELDLGMQYNPESKAKFQYDFLNDDVELNPTDNPDPSEWKMPDTLFNALLDASKTGKRVIFYSNPPYLTVGNMGRDGSSKEGATTTLVNEMMSREGWGNSRQQMYAQFFARVYKLVEDFGINNVYIAFFTKTTQFSGGSYWEEFNNKLLSKYKHIKGNLLQSSEFSDTSDSWGITFSVYKKCELIQNIDRITELSLEEKVLTDTGVIIREINTMRVNMLEDANMLSKWVREGIPKKQQKLTYETPNLSNALEETKATGKPSGKLYSGSLGYMVFGGNSVGEGLRDVCIFTSAAHRGKGFNVYPSNFNNSVVGYSARRVIKPTWYTDKIGYKKPDTTKEGYGDFVNDSLVYSIFDNQSFQAAYRMWENPRKEDTYFSNTTTPGKWANQWFWMSLDEMKDLSNQHNIHDVFNDTRGDEDRFVYNEIQTREFSPEAQKVLDLARQIVIETMPARKIMIQTHPEFYLQAWDAGWYQIKKILDNYPLELKGEFDLALKELRSKIEDGVYEYDMLVR